MQKKRNRRTDGRTEGQTDGQNRWRTHDTCMTSRDKRAAKVLFYVNFRTIFQKKHDNLLFMLRNILIAFRRQFRGLHQTQEWQVSRCRWRFAMSAQTEWCKGRITQTAPVTDAGGEICRADRQCTNKFVRNCLFPRGRFVHFLRRPKGRFVHGASEDGGVYRRGLRHAQTVYLILAALKCWSKQAYRKIMHAPYRITANELV